MQVDGLDLDLIQPILGLRQHLPGPIVRVLLRAVTANQLLEPLLIPQDNVHHVLRQRPEVFFTGRGGGIPVGRGGSFRECLVFFGFPLRRGTGAAPSCVSRPFSPLLTPSWSPLHHSPPLYSTSPPPSPTPPPSSPVKPHTPPSLFHVFEETRQFRDSILEELWEVDAAAVVFVADGRRCGGGLRIGSGSGTATPKDRADEDSCSRNVRSSRLNELPRSAARTRSSSSAEDRREISCFADASSASRSERAAASERI